MVEGRRASAGRDSGHSGSAHVRISSPAILKERYPHPWICSTFKRICLRKHIFPVARISVAAAARLLARGAGYRRLRASRVGRSWSRQMAARRLGELRGRGSNVRCDRLAPSSVKAPTGLAGTSGSVGRGCNACAMGTDASDGWVWSAPCVSRACWLLSSARSTKPFWCGAQGSSRFRQSRSLSALSR